MTDSTVIVLAIIAGAAILLFGYWAVGQLSGSGIELTVNPDDWQPDGEMYAICILWPDAAEHPPLVRSYWLDDNGTRRPVHLDVFLHDDAIIVRSAQPSRAVITVRH